VSAASVDANGIESLFSREITFSNDELSVAENPTETKDFDLLQNRPNPFDEATIIGVKVNKSGDYKQAFILIRDLSGREIERLPIQLNSEVCEVIYEHGYAQIGVYSYTLVVDQKEVATKMMVFAN
jgi:hypothetical protein